MQASERMCVCVCVFGGGGGKTKQFLSLATFNKIFT